MSNSDKPDVMREFAEDRDVTQLMRRLVNHYEEFESAWIQVSRAAGTLSETNRDLNQMVGQRFARDQNLSAEKKKAVKEVLRRTVALTQQLRRAMS